MLKQPPEKHIIIILNLIHSKSKRNENIHIMMNCIQHIDVLQI